jgi:Ca2+/H+ antiporter
VILEGSGIDEKFLGVTLFALVPNTTEFMNAISFALNGNIALRYISTTFLVCSIFHIATQHGDWIGIRIASLLASNSRHGCFLCLVQP